MRKKRNEVMGLKQRYEKGLEKLDFAASQVSVMQQELKDLQPELVKTSAETEKLMAKIEQDTVEVEAKKEVVLFLFFFIAYESLDLKCFGRMLSLNSYNFLCIVTSK